MTARRGHRFFRYQTTDAISAGKQFRGSQTAQSFIRNGRTAARHVRRRASAFNDVIGRLAVGQKSAPNAAGYLGTALIPTDCDAF